MVRLGVPVAIVVTAEVVVRVVLVIVLLVHLQRVQIELARRAVLVTQLLPAFLAEDMRPMLVFETVPLKVLQEVIIVLIGAELLSNALLHLLVLLLDAPRLLWVLLAPVLVGLLVFGEAARLAENEVVILRTHALVAENGVGFGDFLKMFLSLLKLDFVFFHLSRQRIWVVLFSEHIVALLNLVRLGGGRHVEQLVEARLRASDRNRGEPA